MFSVVVVPLVSHLDQSRSLEKRNPFQPHALGNNLLETLDGKFRHAIQKVSHSYKKQDIHTVPAISPLLK